MRRDDHCVALHRYTTVPNQIVWRYNDSGITYIYIYLPENSWAFLPSGQVWTTCAASPWRRWCTCTAVLLGSGTSTQCRPRPWHKRLTPNGRRPKREGLRRTRTDLGARTVSNSENRKPEVFRLTRPETYTYGHWRSSRDVPAGRCRNWADTQTVFVQQSAEKRPEARTTVQQSFVESEIINNNCVNTPCNSDGLRAVIIVATITTTTGVHDW